MEDFFGPGEFFYWPAMNIYENLTWVTPKPLAQLQEWEHERRKARGTSTAAKKAPERSQYAQSQYLAKQPSISSVTRGCEH